MRQPYDDINHQNKQNNYLAQDTTCIHVKMNPKDGLDAHFEITVTRKEAVNGHTRYLQVDNETIEVEVPEKTRTGDKVRVKGRGNRSQTSGIRGDLVLTIVIEDEKEEYEQAQALKRPLGEIEIRALNRVGLNPQSLQKGLDDYIRLYLLEKAEVDVAPVSSSEMTGSGTAAFAAGFTSALIQEGGASAGTALTTGNIKHQTSIQEWIHWKKYALEQPDFEEYKAKESEKDKKMLEVMVKYIRSRKGVACCKYEESRALMGAVIGIATYCTLGLAYLVVLWAKRGSKEVTVVEWLIQKAEGLQAFSSVRPRGRINELGELELEY